MGVWSGVSGLVVIDGPKPTNPNTVDKTLVTTVSGPADGAGLTCGETVTVALVANVFGDVFETCATLATDAVTAKVCTAGLGAIEGAGLLWLLG